MTTKVTSSLINSVANTQITGTITNSQLAGSITADKIVSAPALNTGNWTVFESGGKLYFAYGGVNKFSMDSSGTIIAANNVTAAGTP